MLKVRNLSAGYGQIRVLHGVSFDANPGEIVSILGSNGAGKTTLFKALFSNVDVYEGERHLDEMSLERVPTHRIAHAGLIHVSEGRGLFPGMTVLDNLSIPHYAGLGRASYKDALGMVFELFPKLRDRRRQIAGTMSGGEQQMLAVARGLMAEPRMLLLDEPSIGLAPILVDELFERLRLIHHAKPEMGIVIVEQSVAETLAISDRGYVLERGQVVAAGTSHELATSSAVQDAFMGTTHSEVDTEEKS